MEATNTRKELANGTKRKSEVTFWKMWTDELPVSFPKKRFTEDFVSRWGITYANVTLRFKSESFMYLKADLMFMFENYGIAFDYKKQGFFLDKRQYDLARGMEDFRAASEFGMAK